MDFHPDNCVPERQLLGIILEQAYQVWQDKDYWLEEYMSPAKTGDSGTRITFIVLCHLVRDHFKKSHGHLLYSDPSTLIASQVKIPLWNPCLVGDLMVPSDDIREEAARAVIRQSVVWFTSCRTTAADSSYLGNLHRSVRELFDLLQERYSGGTTNDRS